MPTPNSGESQDEFVDRCMTDSESIADFPDEEQRFAVCNSIYENRNKMKNTQLRQKSGYWEKSFAVDPDSIKVEDATRTVEGYFSSFNVIDSDRDKIMSGAFARSISEHGPASSGNRKIAHLAHHDIRRPVGKLVELKEDDFGLRFKSRMGSHTDGNDSLLMYKDGIITEHSIGFNYIWDKMTFVEDATEPAKSFFQIDELQLWEGSHVTFGSNSETPNLSAVKSQADLNDVLEKIDKRMETFVKALRDNNYSEKFNNLAELELLQIQKQYKALINWEPQAKPKSPDTKEPSIAKSQLNKLFNKIKI